MLELRIIGMCLLWECGYSAPFLLLLDPEHGISAFFLLALVVGPITGALLCNIRHKAISVKDLQNMHTSHDISIWYVVLSTHGYKGTSK